MQRLSVKECSKYQAVNAVNISQQMQQIPVSKGSEYWSANALNISQESAVNTDQEMQ